MRRMMKILGIITIMALLLGGGAVVPVSATPEVTVSIDAPAEAAPGSDFTANVNISEVVDFDACNYDVSFDASVLRLDNVTSGLIDSTTIPISVLNEITSGTWRVVQNVEGYAGVSGSYLAVLHFHVIGSEGDSSAISLSNGMLSNNLAGEIPATWVGDSVNVVGMDTTPPPKGGGGGGGFGPGGDETPPRTYDIVASGINKTSADITWTTNEWSTSQVEYWAGPSKLSPLDETLVIEHVVHLTDLTPGATYHYKVMSRDEAGNLAVSDERSFTTLGAPAAFAVSALDITPAEVDIGEEVTIGVLVTNSGDAAGNCEVTLKIDDVVVATEDIVDLAGGASQKVAFTTAKDAAGMVTVNVNGVTGSFVVKEAPAPEISVFGVTPSYHTETHTLAFARVIYEINNLYQPMTDVELTLKVSLDSVPLEELSLLPPSVLEEDRIAGSRDYVPPQGWKGGTYSFRVELYVGGKLYATTMEEELEVTAASAAPVFSWATLGEIIGATLILIAATVSAILLRRRRLLRRLGQR